MNSAMNENILMRQFLFESLLVTFISFLLSLVVVNLILPSFNAFTNKQLSLGPSSDYRIWLYAVGFAILTGLISGSYPALMLSRFRPVLLLKGLKLSNRRDLSLRKGLVVFQFTVSVILIIGTIVLFMQVRYLNNADLGFNKDQLITFELRGEAAQHPEALKADILQSSDVIAATAGYGLRSAIASDS